MIGAAAVVAGVLTFSEPEFFAPSTALIETREAQLLDLDFEGVAVNAPGVIDTRRVQSLPVILAARFSGERDWDVPLKDNCLLFGTNLADGSVYFAPALTSRKDVTRAGKLKVPKGEKPEGLPLAAAQIVPIDALTKLPMRWNTGVWALGVINYDRPSNVVNVELTGEEPLPSSGPRPINPPFSPGLEGVTLPSYIAMGKNPRQPESGVAFTLERVTIADTAHVHVYGSYCIKIREYLLPREETVHQLPTGRRERVAAIVPLTVALIALDSDLPLQFDCAVPAYGASPLRAGDSVRGYFAIDLTTLPNAPAVGDLDYQAYVLTGGYVYGPIRLTR